MGSDIGKRNMTMITAAISLVLVFIIMILPGYLLVNFLSLRTLDRIERVFYGAIISMTLLMICGFILSNFGLMTPPYIIALLFIYLFAVIFIHMKYGQGHKGDGNRSPGMFGFFSLRAIRKLGKVEITLILMFIVALLLCSVYSQQSQFPTGYDRGNHFGDSLFIANNGYMPDTHPGSNYDPFYYQGPNILMSIISISSVSISTLDLSPIMSDSNNYLLYAQTFNFLFSIFISLGVLAVYVLGKRLFKDWKCGVFASFFFVALMGFGIADLGSIGTNLGFIFISVLLVMLITLREEKMKIPDAILIIVLVMAILLTHIIATSFTLFLLLLVILWDVVKGRFKIRRTALDLTIVVIGIVTWLIFMLAFAPDLFYGILEEIMRKQAETVSSVSISTSASTIDFFETNLDSILNNPLVLIALPLFILGMVYDLMRHRSYIIPLALASFMFALTPILPFIKTMSYLIFPIAILAGIGLIVITKGRRKEIGTVLVCLLITVSLSISVQYLDTVSSSKQYYDEDTYQRVLDLSEWLNEEAESSYTVVFPDSGGPGHTLNALAEGKVLFAEPRYTDLPSFVQCAMLYLEYPTSQKIYNYTEVPAEDKYNITISYGINIIIENSVYQADVEKLRIYYPDLWVLNYSESMNILILEG